MVPLIVCLCLTECAVLQPKEAIAWLYSPKTQVAVVEWSRVRESLDIDTGTAKEYLILFFEMDTDRDGRLSLEV